MKRMTILLLPFLLAVGCEKPKPTYSGDPNAGPAMISMEASPAPSAGPAAATGDIVSLSPDNTKIGFVGTKPMGKHDGEFKKFTGSVKLAAKSVANVGVDFEADSLSTDNPGLTNHLKSPDFFDVKQFPKASFASTKIEPAAGKDGEYTITGDLTIHGVKKSISFPAKVTNEKDNFVLTSSFKIQWKDFGMTYAKPGIDPDVTINVSVGKAK